MPFNNIRARTPGVTPTHMEPVDIRGNAVANAEAALTARETELGLFASPFPLPRADRPEEQAFAHEAVQTVNNMRADVAPTARRQPLTLTDIGTALRNAHRNPPTSLLVGEWRAVCDLAARNQILDDRPYSLIERMYFRVSISAPAEATLMLRLMVRGMIDEARRLAGALWGASGLDRFNNLQAVIRMMDAARVRVRTNAARIAAAALPIQPDNAARYSEIAATGAITGADGRTVHILSPEVTAQAMVARDGASPLALEGSDASAVTGVSRPTDAAALMHNTLAALGLDSIARFLVDGRLTMPDGTPFAEWDTIGQQLSNMQSGVEQIGSRVRMLRVDWWRYGIDNYGEERALQARAVFGVSSRTIANDASGIRNLTDAARRISVENFELYEVVAHAPVDSQESWITRARDGQWSAAELRRQIAGVNEQTWEQQRALAALRRLWERSNDETRSAIFHFVNNAAATLVDDSDEN